MFKTREDRKIASDPKILILNSRQSKTPVGNDLWVKRTIEAVRIMSNQNADIICSIGMKTWELVLWAASEFKTKTTVLLPDSKNKVREEFVEFILDDFSLDSEKCDFIFIESQKQMKSAKNWWEKRDSIAFQMADIILPVSVRENGRWCSLLKSPESSSKHVDYSYACNYHPRGLSGRILFNAPSVEIKISEWNWLTHFTRRFYTPWPGEKSSDFYRAIAKSENTYPRKASDTLKRIINERLLRASGERIRTGKGVVAFTSLDPCDAVKLMKWRSRYVRYTFEPYGLAVRMSAAIMAGVRPVKYVKNGESEKGDNNEFIQGYDKGDWKAESEWRFAGDLDLNMFDPEDIRVIIPSRDEIDEFQQISPFRVMVMDICSPECRSV